MHSLDINICICTPIIVIYICNLVEIRFAWIKVPIFMYIYTFVKVYLCIYNSVKYNFCRNPSSIAFNGQPNCMTQECKREGKGLNPFLSNIIHVLFMHYRLGSSTISILFTIWVRVLCGENNGSSPLELQDREIFLGVYKLP